ncbi:hypothetical protein CVO74_12780 [Xanthomonas prunicola]|nr:hypothetical protein CVO74_12780 [Xanthomonas prunicola]
MLNLRRNLIQIDDRLSDLQRRSIDNCLELVIVATLALQWHRLAKMCLLARRPASGRQIR